MDLPILDLTKHLHHVKKADFEVELVKGVYQFIAMSSKSLQDKLTDLFDFLAWHSLSTALKIINMGNNFHEHMKHLPWAEQNWASTESCLCKLFCLDVISVDILEIVFSFKSISQEEPADFNWQFNTLIWAAGVVDSASEPNMPHHYLIEVLFWAVPSTGQQVILTHFENLSAIWNYQELLNLICESKNILIGSHKCAGRWAATNWAPDLAPKDSYSSMSSSPYTNEGIKSCHSPSPYHQNRGSNSSKSHHSSNSHTAPSVTKPSSWYLPPNQKWCDHPWCTMLPEHAKHFALSCRHYPELQRSTSSSYLSRLSDFYNNSHNSSNNLNYSLHSKADSTKPFNPASSSNSSALVPQIRNKGHIDSQKDNLLAASNSDDDLGQDHDYSSHHDIARLSNKVAHASSSYSNVPKCSTCHCEKWRH